MTVPTALVVLAEGSESLETVTVVNVLRRGGVTVTLAGLGTDRLVEASRGITLQVDRTLDELDGTIFDAVVLPGGEIGARALAAHAGLRARLQAQRVEHRWIGAICAAPALVLAPIGLLDGKQATGYPALREAILHYVDLPVVVDGHTVTAQGPASAIAFGLTLVEKLGGDRPAVAAALLAT